MSDYCLSAFRLYVRLSVGIVVCFLFAGTPAYPQQKVGDPQSVQGPQTVQNNLNDAVTANMNERLMELAAALKTTQGEYLIGPSDVLSIEVFDVPELTREIHVNETGDIALPLVRARVHVTGLTTLQLQEKIKEILQTNGLISDPEVTVAVKEQHSEPVTVIGAVRSPMVFQADRQSNLLEVLSRAGGISEDAGSVVMVTRTASPAPATAASAKVSDVLGPKPQTFTINLNDLLDTGDGRFNIPVIGGDVVSVPRAGIVYVVGAVSRPGGFVMANDRDRLTALKALALAGGMTATAKSTHAVILRRDADSGQRQEVPVDLHRILHLQGEDTVLQASDILYVPDSTGKKALRAAGTVAVSLASAVALARVTGY